MQWQTEMEVQGTAGMLVKERLLRENGAVLESK